MSRLSAWFVHVSAIMVGASGLVYGWMRYFAEPSDEFAVVNHPLEPTLKSLHIVFAPLLVFACGVLWRDHIWGRVRMGHPSRRKTGLLLFGLVLPMVASGYLLQVSVDESWRLLWMWSHGIVSTLWIAGYLVHQLQK